MAKHPHYSNPQIVEALCEVHFALPREQPWKPTIPGAFFKVVQQDYPEIEPITEQGVLVTIGPDGIPIQQLSAPKIKFKFKHINKPFLLQLSDQTFTINVLPKYPGWEGIKSELESRWRQFCDIAGPESIHRVGLRYINSVKRNSANEQPNYWLRDSRYLAKILLESGPGYVGRSEIRLDEMNRLIVGITHDHTNPPPYGALILDIDRICEAPTSVEWKQFDNVLEKMHDGTWEVFDSLCGARFKKLINSKV